MKKEFLKAKLLLAAVMMAAATMFVACDKDDVDGGKKNNQTDTPTNLRLERKGTTLSAVWMAASGADSYEVTAFQVGTVDDNGKVDDYDEAVTYEVKTTEWSNASFTIEKGYNYMIQVVATTEGKKDSEPLTAVHKFYVSGIMPLGGELSVVIPELIAEKQLSATDEVEVRLLEGVEYTLDATLDFEGHPASIVAYEVLESGDVKASDKHPIVKFGQNGRFRTAKSISLKNLSIDATEQDPEEFPENQTTKGWAIVEGSLNTDAATLQADKSNWLIDGITFDGCYVKNLHCNLIHHGVYAYAFDNLTVNNCVIQLDNDGTYHGDAAVLSSYGGGINPAGGTNWRVGAVRNIKVTNSTIYNIKENGANRMIRWNGNSISHHFFAETASCTFDNCTLSQVMTNKEFGNGTFNNAAYTITFTNNVYRDCYRLKKFIQGNCTQVITNNLGWWSGTVGPKDGETGLPSIEAGNMEDDTEWIAGLNGGISVENFSFEGNVNAALDFNAEDGLGVNFKTAAASTSQGDPRWK